MQFCDICHSYLHQVSGKGVVQEVDGAVASQQQPGHQQDQNHCPTFIFQAEMTHAHGLEHVWK